MKTDRAIFFGAIGTLVETSDMQRRAFNAAFEDAGLDWRWSAQEYAGMLTTVGGQNRIEAFAASHGQQVDAAALHSEKSRIFQAMMQRDGLELRPGVAALIKATRQSGHALAWVSSTSRENIDAILAATGDALSADMFDLITDRTMVDAPKPDPAIYTYALDALDLTPRDVLAIEDTPSSAQAAHDAGIDVVAFEGAAGATGTWPEVQAHLDDLSSLCAAPSQRHAAQ